LGIFLLAASLASGLGIGMGRDYCMYLKDRKERSYRLGSETLARVGWLYGHVLKSSEGGKGLKVARCKERAPRAWTVDSDGDNRT
jgi:hypothetical protein